MNVLSHDRCVRPPYLKLGLKEAKDSPGNDAPDTTPVDAENRNQVPVGRRLERNTLCPFH